MPSCLYPESKRALLEQAMRVRKQSGEHSDIFVKLLMINHSFINMGRFYEISQLVIDMLVYLPIDIFFGIDYQNRTRGFNFSAQQTREIIELFQIQKLKICSSIDSKNRFFEYWSLIDCVEGKIDVDFSSIVEPEGIELVNRFWNKITTLHGPFNILSSHCQPYKYFDKLSVFDVNSIADLNAILRNEASELEIDYIGDLSLDEINQFFYTAPKTKTKKFKLSRHIQYGEIDLLVPFVQFISAFFPKCETIELSLVIVENEIAQTMQELVEKIMSDYETFTKAKNLLSALPFEFDLSVSASHDTSMTYFKTNDGWFDRAKQMKPELSEGVYEVKDNGRRASDEIVIQSVDESLKSTFTVAVRYEADDNRNNSNYNDHYLDNDCVDSDYSWEIDHYRDSDSS